MECHPAGGGEMKLASASFGKIAHHIQVDRAAAPQVRKHCRGDAQGKSSASPQDAQGTQLGRHKWSFPSVALYLSLAPPMG